MDIHPIARISSGFSSKFGIPRQSGISQATKAAVIFEPEYRNPDFIRGLSEFSHIWLLWEFSEALGAGVSATVRPPRLGGNRRIGVFASRSPFRPNHLGLSSVRLDYIEHDTPQGDILHISGADIMDGTPIYDIKPYIVYTDSHPEALDSFAGEHSRDRLRVIFPEALKNTVSPDTAAALEEILACDPRPSYQNDSQRVYGFGYEGYEIRFSVDGDTLSVKEVLKY